MSNTEAITEPLGVVALFSECMGLVFKNLGTLLPIALIPSVLGVLVNYLVMGPASLNSFQAFIDPVAAAAAQAQVTWLGQALTIALGIVLWGFIMTSMTRAVFDIKQTGSASVGDAISTGIRYMLPILPVVIVSGLAIYLGMALLILPGLYLMAMWFVIVPCFIVEQHGFGSLKRSAELTQGYRWPLVGLGLLFVLAFFVFAAVSGGLQLVFAGMGGVGLVLAAITTILIAGISYCIGSGLAALTYVRLREIKEGLGLSEVADIFE